MSEEDFTGKKANDDFGQSLGRGRTDVAGDRRRAVNNERGAMALSRTMQRHYRRAVRHDDARMIGILSDQMGKLGVNPAGGVGFTDANQQDAIANDQAINRNDQQMQVRKSGVSGSGKVNPGTREDANALVPKTSSPINAGGGLDEGDSTESGAPVATTPVASPSAPQGNTGNLNPGGQPQRVSALDDKKKQFAIEKFGKDITDWTINDPEDQGKKSASIYEYGKTLGITPDQIEAQANKARDRQVAGAKEKSKYMPSKDTLDMESKFDAMIADRPDDQKAMFSKMSDEDKAAMVQKNASLKTVREEMSNLSEKHTGQGLQDGDKELAKGLQTMSPEAKARSDKDAESIASGKKSSADYDAAEALRVSGRANGFDKIATQEVKNTKDNSDATKAVELINSGRKLNFEDIKKNSKDFLGPTQDSIGGFLSSAGHQIKKAVTGNRQDAQAPAMDWDAFDKRDPNDPNFGQKVYQSQYNANGNSSTTKTPETGGPVTSTKDSPTIGFGGKATKRAWDNYGNSGTFGGGRGDPGTPWWESIGRVFSEANTPPTQKGGSGFPSAPQALNTTSHQQNLDRVFQGTSSILSDRNAKLDQLFS